VAHWKCSPAKVDSIEQSPGGLPQRPEHVKEQSMLMVEFFFHDLDRFWMLEAKASRSLCRVRIQDHIVEGFFIAKIKKTIAWQSI
jgi:hypothetical protein